MSANIDSLLARIQSQINNNGNQEITGLVLQSVLKDISNTLNNYAVGQKKGKGEVFNDVVTNVASGEYSHADGILNEATGNYSHSQNRGNKSIGIDSHSQGAFTTARGRRSSSSGEWTIASGDNQSAVGKFNKESTSLAFILGNGSSDTARGDAFTIGWDGNVRADGTYESPAADYAEFFEWADGNINAEDRVGYIVAMEGEKIKKASAGDFLVGIISARPAIIGDSPMDWHGKYLNDEWGRPIYEDVEVSEEMPDGKVITRTDHRRKLNPEWDSTIPYIDRRDRKEWDAVGMFGKLLVRQDGSLKQGGFCAPSNGIATDSKKGWYVMKVIDAEKALVLVK